jgi:FkbM family methyltransferase
MQSPFFHYNTCFDPLALIEKYKCKQPQTSPSHVVNFLGLKINPEFMPECVRHLCDQVEPPPNPANWHADVSEFGAVFRAVDLSSENGFVMGELGCGWGCWMGISGMVAKKRGLNVKLYGIEGDKKHISWAKENMATNGFAEDEFTVVGGIASSKCGKALFPLGDKRAIHYGLEPIFNASELEIQKALKNKSHEILPMVPLEHIFKGESRVDLLHIDIQGGEVDLIDGSIDYLSKNVAYLVIGTHSRSIEGKLLDILLKNGWILEIERPAIFQIKQRDLVTAVDGVQGWRNPELLPEPQGINVVIGNKTLRTKFIGWSKEEPTHRWSEGLSCSLEFKIPEITEALKKLILKGFSYGNQCINVILNEKSIFKTTLTGAPQELEIKIPRGVFKTGLNKIDLELPDAKVPDNGDPRKLGFALQELQIT